jgi:hypothetical protein
MATVKYRQAGGEKERGIERRATRERNFISIIGAEVQTRENTQPRGRFKWIQFLEGWTGHSDLTFMSDSSRKLIKETRTKRFIDGHPTARRRFSSR